jgi:hypothetical protein
VARPGTCGLGKRRTFYALRRWANRGDCRRRRPHRLTENTSDFEPFANLEEVGVFEEVPLEGGIRVENWFIS